MKRPILRALLVSAALPLLGAPGLAQTSDAFVWWESENFARSNMTTQHTFAPANAGEADALSGGKWIGADGQHGETKFAEYQISVPQNGKYNFYARKFWHHGPFRWKFDDRPFQTLERTALLDDVPLRTFVGANWVHVGEVELSKGTHTLRVELTKNEGAAAFDAFVLTPTAFAPRGKLKPGEKYNRAPEGFVPFEPDADPFSKNAALDLRSLNEDFAGRGGFIKTRGEEFIHGRTGEAVRFWAVNTGMEPVRKDRASVDLMARTLAKRGVNLIRVHGPIADCNSLQITDEDLLDDVRYFVTAMKRQGIYTLLSIYFPLWYQPNESSGLEGYDGTKNPFASLYFNPKFQEKYRTWWRRLLSEPNPHSASKTPLTDDPGVAFLELVNEDSFFFWTFSYDRIPEPQMRLLEEQFGEWAAKKYGTLEEAFRVWSPQIHERDNATELRAGFMPLYEIFNKKNLRAQDTARFLAEKQAEFHREHAAFLRNDLGFKGSIQASNWITADARVLGPLDKWTNLQGADFIDRHGYFGGPHEGERAGYSISSGDKYQDRSALLFRDPKSGNESFGLPIWDLRYNNAPSALSEFNWTPPNRFRAEWPLLAASYGALQGTDALMFFATGASTWDSTIGKFALSTPSVLGQFPAAALIYRKGLVKEADDAVRVGLKEKDVFELKGAPVSAPLNLDELRARDIPAGGSAPVEEVKSIDPLAFAAGKVTLDISQSGGASKVADLSKYIDREKKVVRSLTGEMTWNYGDGLWTLNAPQAQAASGFFSNVDGKVSLGTLQLTTPLEYGAVTLVSLDGAPLQRSKKMLLQVMSEESNYGFETKQNGAMREIVSVGAPPLAVRKIEGIVGIKRPDASKLRVTALDANGYKKATLGTASRIQLQPGTIYYLIEAS